MLSIKQIKDFSLMLLIKLFFDENDVQMVPIASFQNDDA